MSKVRATRHNGRAGKNGVYTTKHNDRNFDVTHAEHIDPTRTALNVYWDWENGKRTGEKGIFECEDGSVPSFEDAEKHFYEQQYAGYVAGQDLRNALTRHKKRNRTVEQIRHDKRFCPEESIYQFGREGNGATGEQLMAIVEEFLEEFTKRYGTNIHILDWALHMDETTVHIQERHCFDYVNKYGEIEPKQEKALEALGIPLPDPDEEQNRYNNRKVTFDAMNRLMLIEIAKKHGLDIEEQVKYGGQKHMEKLEYIITQQLQKLQEQEVRIAEQETQIGTLTNTVTDLNHEIELMSREAEETELKLKDVVTALTEAHEEMNEKDDQIAQLDAELAEKELKLEDVDTLLKEVTDITYNQAITVAAATMTGEVKKQSTEVINNLIEAAGKPDSGLKKAEQPVVRAWLGRARSAMSHLLSNLFDTVRDKLMLPAIQEKAKAKIIEEARPSVLALLKTRLATESHGKKAQPER